MSRPDGLDDAEQERLRVEFFALDRPELDPDPLHVEAYEDGFVAGVAHGVAHERRRDHLAAVALAGAILALLITAFAVGRASAAAPRTAQTTERVDVSAPSSAGPSGAPHMRAGESSSAMEPIDSRMADVGAPLPSPAAVATDPPSATSRGIASWYDDGPGLYGAVHSWRWGDTPYRVIVRAGGRSAVVTIRDFCGCPAGRVIDLSPAAFRRLASLSAGLVRVTVTRVGPGTTPPPTDVEAVP